MSAQFLIEQRMDYFSYTFISDDENILFFSPLYRSVSECRQGIQTLIECAPFPKYIQASQEDNAYSFSVRDRKSRVLGHSTVFFARSSRDYAIRKLSLQAASASIVGPHTDRMGQRLSSVTPQTTKF